MRPTQLLLNAAKKSTGPGIPVELTPLFFAVGVALCSGTYFTYKKFTYDDSLRLKQNPEQSGLKALLESESEHK